MYNQPNIKRDLDERTSRFGFADSMVADETITTDCEELMNWLTEKGHPVLNLEPLM